MSERLENWAPRVAGALERVPAAVAARAQDLAREAREAARRRAPRRTGRLQASIDAAFRGTVSAGRIVVSASSPGAELQEEGGTVHGSPFLAIPLRPDIDQHRRGPRADGDLFIIRRRDGRFYLASRRGGALDVRWRLIDQVRVPAQHFLRPAAEQASQRLSGEVVAAIDRELGVRR